MKNRKENLDLTQGDTIKTDSVPKPDLLSEGSSTRYNRKKLLNIYLEIRKNFFPLWDKHNQWKIRYCPQLLAGGLCNSEKKTILINSFHNFSLELYLLLIHEICHAVIGSGHGKKFQNRMKLAAIKAIKLGLNDLAKMIQKEIDCYIISIKPDIKSELYDWITESGDYIPSFEEVLKSLASQFGISKKNILKYKKGIKKVYQKAVKVKLEDERQMKQYKKLLVSYAKQINEKDPNIAQEIRDGKKSIAKAVNQINKAERISKIKRNEKKYKTKNYVQIVCADFYQWCKENLKDNSIDLILTEPPCTKKDLPLWEKLAEESAKVLKPSGFLVSYCGHRYIDKVIHILSKLLNYHWLYCIGLNGNGKNFSQNNLIEKWQPVLVYYKPPFRHDRI